MSEILVAFGMCFGAVLVSELGVCLYLEKVEADA